MYEDDFLEAAYEDRMADYYADETYGADPYFDYDDEPGADEDEVDEGDYIREDFGWFGDEALCGE